MNRWTVATIAMLVLAACQAEAPAPAPAPAATGALAAAPEPAAEIETTMAEPGVQPDAAASDARALAGTYAGLLPCADCPGIDETLVLDPDGGYVLTDSYRESDGAAHVVQGTWSIEPDGKRIRLDPGDKGDADRIFAIEADALVGDGPVDMRLVRER